MVVQHVYSLNICRNIFVLNISALFVLMNSACVLYQASVGNIYPFPSVCFVTGKFYIY